MVFLEILTEFCGGGGVRFDRPDFADAFREGDGNDARAGTDIEDKVTFFEVAMADEFEREAWRSQEMLRKEMIATGHW